MAGNPFDPQGTDEHRQFHISVHCPECDDDMVNTSSNAYVLPGDAHINFVCCDNKVCSQRGVVWCVNRITGRGVTRRPLEVLS